MANTKSAIKRVRQTIKRQKRNQNAYSQVATAIKAVKQAVLQKDGKAAKIALQTAIPLIDKAAQKRLLHPSNASRKISRLTLQVNTLSH